MKMKAKKIIFIYKQTVRRNIRQLKTGTFKDLKRLMYLYVYVVYVYVYDCEMVNGIVYVQ